ncbi:MAG: signal peptidase II [Candidatus Omnitrophica bacterium]|nr:signal peptidase II [Candidatus Omnitrophota bacterium]
MRGGEEKTPSLNRGLFFLLAGLVVLLDQLTKAFALKFLSFGESWPVLSSIFHLTLVQNQGIAFGLFQGFDKILLLIITVSIGILVVVALRSDPLRPRAHLALGLILGGAFGNWIDRIRIGSVIDFLDFRIWPVFNLADTAITIGVGLFMLEFFKKSHA